MPMIKNYSTIISKLILVALVFTGMSAIVGCSSHRRERYSLPEVAVVAQTPVFLSGAIAVLLTNANAYSAHLVIDSPNSNKVSAVSGQLLSQGTHLVFAPTGSDKTYIWDVQHHNGFVLSEALQGYAPISSPAEVTNVSTISETAGPSFAVVNGHPGHEAEISVAANDGSKSTFSIWRASDLDGIPVRIKVLTGSEPYMISLSLVHSENLSDKLFQPPEGFTRYTSAEAIASELLSRKTKMRSNGSASSDFDRPPGPPYSR